MERIVKYKTKSVLNPHQIKYLKVNKKNLQHNSNNLGKVEENNLKFINNRQFGNDLTIPIKNRKKIKINNTKKSNSIYQNKTNLILDKRKNLLINNNKHIICDYSSKPSNYNHIDSSIKYKINTKKNNSVCLINGYQKSKDSFINSKINENTSNNHLELNTSGYNIL